MYAKLTWEACRDAPHSEDYFDQIVQQNLDDYGITSTLIPTLCYDKFVFWVLAKWFGQDDFS